MGFLTRDSDPSGRLCFAAQASRCEPIQAFAASWKKETAS